jgi:hypothetical protein
LVALVLHYVSLDNYLVHLYNTALILAALKHARESESPREAEARKSAFDLHKSNYDHHLGKWSHNINRAVDAKRKELASVPTVAEGADGETPYHHCDRRWRAPPSVPLVLHRARPRVENYFLAARPSAKQALHRIVIRIFG